MKTIRSHYKNIAFDLQLDHGCNINKVFIGNQQIFPGHPLYNVAINHFNNKLSYKAILSSYEQRSAKIDV